MTQEASVPQQIKDFINFLQTEGLYKLYDLQKSAVLFNAPANIQLPFNFLTDLFKKHCPNESYEDYSAYIISNIEKIVGFYFKPSLNKLINVGIGAQRLNLYKPYIRQTNNSDCQLFIELIERLVPVPEENKIFMQWLAHMIQKPDERPTWAVMMTSEEGTGKGVLFHHVLKPLLMNQAVQCSKYSQLTGEHAMALVNSMLVMLDDTKTNSDATITELKSKISEPSITVNPKHLQPYCQEVFARVLLASNEVRPIKLGKNDTRRWLALQYIKHPVSKEETREFIGRFLDWLDQPNSLDSIFNYLNNLSLDGFDSGKSFETETLKMMVEVSESSRESAVREWCEDKKVFKLEELRRAFSDYPDLAKTYALGFAEMKYLFKDGVRSRWWRLKTITNKEATLILNPVDIGTPVAEIIELGFENAIECKAQL